MSTQNIFNSFFDLKVISKD